MDHTATILNSNATKSSVLPKTAQQTTYGQLQPSSQPFLTLLPPHELQQPQQQLNYCPQCSTPLTQEVMFSWSTPARSQYPGRRTHAATTSPLIAQPIQGSIRPPEYTRAQHLQSYVDDAVLKRSTRKISRDDTTYDTVFQTTNGKTLILRVHVPPTGSKVPVMTLAGVKATHPWIDSMMRVTGYAPIQSDDTWRLKRILLGEAVHEVVKHFQLNAPTVFEILDESLKAIQPRVASANGTAAAGAAMSANPTSNGVSNNGSDVSDSPPSYSTLLDSNIHVELPQLPTRYDALDNMTREDMELLLEDEVQLITFANKLPVMEKILEVRCSILDENVEKAKAHLEKEQHLQNLHQQVTQLRKQLRSAVEQFRLLEKQQDSLCAPPEKRKVLKELAKAKKEAYDQSERLAEEWLENEGSVDDFVRDFVNLRMTHHVRAAKMELLQSK